MAPDNTPPDRLSHSSIDCHCSTTKGAEKSQYPDTSTEIPRRDTYKLDASKTTSFGVGTISFFFFFFRCWLNQLACEEINRALRIGLGMLRYSLCLCCQERNALSAPYIQHQTMLQTHPTITPMHTNTSNTSIDVDNHDHDHRSFLHQPKTRQERACRHPYQRPLELVATNVHNIT